MTEITKKSCISYHRSSIQYQASNIGYEILSILYQVFFQPPGLAHEVGGELLEHGPLLLLRAVLLRDVEREEDDRGHGEGELQLKRSFWL